MKERAKYRVLFQGSSKLGVSTVCVCVCVEQSEVGGVERRLTRLAQASNELYATKE